MAGRNERRRRREQLQARQSQLQAQVVFQQTLTQGPLPPAEQLAQYNDVSPGAADIVFREFQAQSAHRRRMESIIVHSDAIRSIVGVFIGGGLGAYIIYTGGMLLQQGQTLTGFGAIGTAVAIAAGPFLVRNYLQSKERQRQQEIIAAHQRR